MHASREFVTTTAFHKLRSAKKRMSHRYCRQRMAGGQPPPPHSTWEGSEQSTPKGSRGAAQSDDHQAYERQHQKDQEEMARLAQELKQMRAQSQNSMPAPAQVEEMRSKSSLFGRKK